jgi:FG-GAP-like repeat
MTDPTTALHYTANGNFVNGVYAPGADGFNLADVSSVAELNALPPGVKGLVYLGLTNGADANFQVTVSAFKNNPNLYGFYIADEPGGGLAANLKVESDWIHANVPGAKTFIIEQNLSSDTNPDFVYNPANTDIDLFGLDPYPIKASGVDYSIIPTAVSAAEGAGIPLADIVPVYQAFGGGGYSNWILPTPAQEQQILSTWGSVVPAPALDFAYSWGVQVGDTALSDDPALQAVFAAHNGASAIPAPAAPTSPHVDFNDDGHSDILWQNTSTGQASIWEMNGTNVIGGGLVGAAPGPSWQAIGTGDFNADGHSDILWQNVNTGQASIWELNGTNVIGNQLVGAAPGPSWKAIGTGDYNGDGHSDILWQNTSGQASIWEMNGTNVISETAVGANPGPSWLAIKA